MYMKEGKRAQIQLAEKHNLRFLILALVWKTLQTSRVLLQIPSRLPLSYPFSLSPNSLCE